MYSIRTDRILHSCTVSRNLMASVNKKNGSVNLIKKIILLFFSFKIREMEIFRDTLHSGMKKGFHRN